VSSRAGRVADAVGPVVVVGAADGSKMGRGGARGGSKFIIEPHKHQGIFIARGKEPMLVTKTLPRLCHDRSFVALGGPYCY
jgi:hypothetical protein